MSDDAALTQPKLSMEMRQLFDALRLEAAGREDRAEKRADDRAGEREANAVERNNRLVEKLLEQHATIATLKVEVTDLKFRQDRVDRLAFPQLLLRWLVIGVWVFGSADLAIRVWGLIFSPVVRTR